MAGPLGFGFLDMDVGAVEIRVIADLTLAMMLFLDAANADLKVCRAGCFPRCMWYLSGLNAQRRCDITI